MAIKVFFGPDGPYAVADTPEEAMALLKGAAPNGHGISASRPQAKISEEDTVSAFFNSINDNARKFMIHLAKHKGGINGDKLAEETGFAPEKFGGILGGASKLAAKHGLSLDSFVISKMLTDESRRYRFVEPGSLLLKYAAKLSQGERQGALIVKV
jgi:hypothetical protein